MRFPSWLTWYSKPEYRDIKEYATAVSSGRRPLSPDGRGKTAIPSRLKLERVLENRTCSPMSLYDFYMYLKYIEFSPENLEFYIWYQNYEAHWNRMHHGEKDDGTSSSMYSHSEASINKPPFSPADSDYDLEATQDTVSQIAGLISSHTKCSTHECHGSACEVGPTVKSAAQKGTRQLADLSSVLSLYVYPGSEKELNIPPSMREEALQALATSGDPIHLKPIADHVYLLLRNCSHRNFVRLGVSNGTYETICVATGLGIVLTIAGFLCVLLRGFTPSMGSHSRFDAFAAWPMWWLGMSLILAGLRGSCFFLLLFSRRQPLPWERFDDREDANPTKTGILKLLSRLMIFDRKVRVKDIHLRRLQHKIVLQSLGSGAIFASLGVVLFIFLPIWKETVTR